MIWDVRNAKQKSSGILSPPKKNIYLANPGSTKIIFKNTIAVPIHFSNITHNNIQPNPNPTIPAATCSESFHSRHIKPCMGQLDSEFALRHRMRGPVPQRVGNGGKLVMVGPKSAEWQTTKLTNKMLGVCSIRPRQI